MGIVAVLGFAGCSGEVPRGEPADDNPLWALVAPGTGVAHVEEVALDSEGNVVLLGTFTEEMDLDGAVLASAGLFDVFLAKLSPEGQLLWAKSFGSADFDRGRALAIDGTDNLVVTGSFSGRIDFGAGELTSAASSSAFLVKLDPAGVALWSRGFGDDGFTSGVDVSIGVDDRIYVTGDFVASADFGGGPVASLGSSDIFVASFAPGGEPLVSRTLGDTGLQEARGMAVAPSGDVSLLGLFEEAAPEPGSPPPHVLRLARFDERLNHAWSVPAVVVDSTLTNDQAAHLHMHPPNAHSVAVDEGSRTAVTGTRSTGIDFLETPGPGRAVVQVFEKYGDTVVDHAISEEGTQDEGAVAFTESGALQVAGTFLGTLELGESGERLESAGGRDVYLLQIGTDGVLERARRFGEADASEWAWSIARGPTRTVVGGWSRPVDVVDSDRALVLCFPR